MQHLAGWIYFLNELQSLMAADTSINTAPAERKPQVSVTAAEGSRQSREVKANVVLIHCAMSLMSSVYFRIKIMMKNKKDE